MELSEEQIWDAAAAEICEWSGKHANDCNVDFVMPGDPEAFADFKKHTQWHIENGVRQGLFCEGEGGWRITERGKQFFDGRQESEAELQKVLGRPLTILLSEGTVSVRRGTYQGGGLALKLFCDEGEGWVPGEPYGNATVNLMDEGLQQNHAYLDVNNIPEIVEVLEGAGAGWATGRKRLSGYVEYPLFAFRKDWLLSVPSL